MVAPHERRIVAAHAATPGTLAVALLLTTVAGAAPFDHDHARWDAVLQAHVEDGWVQYGAIRDDPAELDTYLASLAAVKPEELAGFSREQAMALWINAYNALTVATLVRRGPVDSIRDIDGVWSAIEHDVAGQRVTLDHVEHQILRERYPDPWLHVALVCGARSCPILEDRAYTAANLQPMMARAAKRFAHDEERNRWDPETRTLRVSRIFEWFGADFVARYAAVVGGDDETAAIRGFFAAHLVDPDIAGEEVRVEYLDYDWQLNGSW